MNVLEASDLIDRAVSLGMWPTTTPDLLAEQSESWADMLRDVPLEWALKYVTEYRQPYGIRPSMIRGAFEEDKKRAARARNIYDERACAHQRLCHCSHAPGVCNRGFVDTPREWETITVGERRTRDDTLVEVRRDVVRDQFCPTCWDAKNQRRAELHKEPLDVGVIGPNV